jgi:hypothetical protein
VAPHADEEHWKGALGTAGNVARFHRVPPLLVFAEGVTAPGWPSQAVPCVAPRTAMSPATPAHAQRWPDDPAAWPTLPVQAGHARLITTAADVQSTLALAELLGHVQRVRAVA